MEVISHETFEKWAKDNKWLLVGEVPTPAGKHLNYVTPSGTITIAMFDLKGNLQSMGQPAAQQAAPPIPRNLLQNDQKGRFPFGGHPGGN